MMKGRICLGWLGLLLLPSCLKETAVAVCADFTAVAVDSNYTVPVGLKIDNRTTGADSYEWTFDGGIPGFSSEKTPEGVVYNEAGTYTIRLKARTNYAENEKALSITVYPAVQTGFTAEIIENDFVPAQVVIHNTTRGAQTYQWTFEGGLPAQSEKENPDTVVFSSAGEHLIHLTVSNGFETFTKEATIRLQPALAVDFDIVPGANDSDYEVPFTADLVNKTISGLSCRWTASGGQIADATAENTTLTLDTPGTYEITLQGDNRKEVKSVTKTITVKANSNLFMAGDVRFGIKSAAESIGCFYSLERREIIAQNPVPSDRGRAVDLVFFGLNSEFIKCYFTSPDKAVDAGFYAIPDAKTTYVVNNPTGFGNADFDAMTDDSILRKLDIRSAGNTTDWFDGSLPRVVLFETAAGRKGAIKIKAFVDNGADSYILTDIKFQK